MSQDDHQEPKNVPGNRTVDDGAVGDGMMSLLDHLVELRNRLGFCIVFFLVVFVATLVRPFGADTRSIADFVFLFLQDPLMNELEKSGGRMIFTALHEAFFTQIKVGFFAALFVSFPLILLQIWRFIAPGLYQTERRAFIPFLIATPMLFLIGGAMVYYLVIPIAWDFFLSFQIAATESSLPIEVEPRISEYLSLVMGLIFAFGIAFELPVVLLLLARARIITASGMARNRKYAILLAFVAAAILTPPDPISQVMLAIPVILLYEISIFAARVMVNQSDIDDEQDGD
jgi:sec-independent protein translocase protein TatC